MLWKSPSSPTENKKITLKYLTLLRVANPPPFRTLVALYGLVFSSLPFPALAHMTSVSTSLPVTYPQPSPSSQCLFFIALKFLWGLLTFSGPQTWWSSRWSSEYLLPLLPLFFYFFTLISSFNRNFSLCWITIIPAEQAFPSTQMYRYYYNCYHASSSVKTYYVACWGRLIIVQTYGES